MLKKDGVIAAGAYYVVAPGDVSEISRTALFLCLVGNVM